MDLRQFWQSFGEGAVYYPQLAQKMGGVSAAILYQTLWHWLGQKATVQCSSQEMTAATGLSEEEQALARDALKARSLLEFSLICSQPPVYSYTLNVEQLEQRLLNHPSVFDQTVSPAPTSAKRDPYFPPRRQPIAVNVTPHYQFEGPWESQQQLDAFQDALLNYAKHRGYSNPGGWVFKIIDSISKGIKSPFWDEFVAGIPFGESQKVQQEWEIEPGVPYPAFESERIQYYVHQGEPLEAAVAKARSELRNPVKAKDLWDGFLRKCDRVADEALKAKKAGVQTPYLPPAFSEQTTVTKASVMAKFSQLQGNTPLLEEDQPPEKTLSPEEEEKTSDIPSWQDLQKLYQSPMTRSWVEEQIRKHPEWGYRIVEGEIIDQYPF
ncbi:MAG: hypothetical protein GVY04_22045 [Cyanobacteria bacterium]|jgi:hypothetical protein|nr:hypothetical protein [Cyanobacteria bacterium GSL.Bin1]